MVVVSSIIIQTLTHHGSQAGSPSYNTSVSLCVRWADAAPTRGQRSKEAWGDGPQGGPQRLLTGEWSQQSQSPPRGLPGAAPAQGTTRLQAAPLRALGPERRELRPREGRCSPEVTWGQKGRS